LLACDGSNFDLEKPLMEEWSTIKDRHKDHEAAAAELMEATKRAGVLDLQVGLEA